MAGRRPRPQVSSPGLCAQPPSAAQASHCANVSSYLPMAKLRIVTLRCGPSLLPRPISLSGEPIVKEPAGTTTMSGQAAQSRNVRPLPGESSACFLWATACGERSTNSANVATVRNIGFRLLSSTPLDDLCWPLLASRPVQEKTSRAIRAYSFRRSLSSYAQPLSWIINHKERAEHEEWAAATSA